MKAVFGEAQNRHAPSRFLRYGNVGEYPESPERVERLIDGATKAGLELIAPRRFELDHIAAVHTPRYLDFLQNGFAEWAALPGAHAEMVPSLRPVATPAEYPQHILGRPSLGERTTGGVCLCRIIQRKTKGNFGFLE